MAHFDDIEATTKNIPKTLLKFCAAKGFKPADVDFELLTYESFYRVNPKDEWIEYSDGEDRQKFSKEDLISKELEFSQEYKIRIQPMKKAKDEFNFVFTLATDKFKTKVAAVIKTETHITDDYGAAERIKSIVHNRKLRSGLMIDFFEDDLDEEIDKFLKHFKKYGTLSEPYKMMIALALPPKPPKNDSIIYHYHAEKDGKKAQVDGVEIKELILEYSKEQYGEDGRGCDGKFIESQEPNIKYDKYIKIDDSITAVENETSIKYFSNIDGYVKNNSGNISISKELELKSATFKGTGSIKPGETKDLIINIEGSDSASDDTVGSGVNIEVKELNIGGTVGANSKVTAGSVKIGGQTHQNSTVIVHENAYIKLHRGKLKAKEADIDILENGIIEADIVRVKMAVGGEIHAREIYIDEIKSHLNATASNLIEVKSISGEGSKLIIDPLSIEFYKKKITSLKDELDTMLKDTQKRKKDLDNCQAEYNSAAGSAKQFKQNIIRAKKEGRDPSPADIIRLKKFQGVAQKLTTLTQEMQSDEKITQKVKSDLQELYDIELHSKVVNHGTYNSNTTVIFVDVETKEVYKILPHGKVETICLEKDGDKKKIVSR